MATKKTTKENIIKIINTSIEENDFFKMQKGLQDAFISLSLIKPDLQPIQEISALIYQHITKIPKDVKNSLFTLSFIMQISSNISIIPSYLIEISFIDNQKTSNILIELLKHIYIKGENQNNFQLPSLQIFINFCFKLPDILSNYFQSQFINHSQYYESLIVKLINNTEAIAIDGIIDKIAKLKLYTLFFKSIIHNDIDINKTKNAFELIEANEFYKENFIKHLFITKCDNENEYSKMIYLYNLITLNVGMDKIDKIIRKNQSFVYLIISCDNITLQGRYLKIILVLLKDKSKFIVDEIEIYEFYSVFFSIYYIIENIQSLNILEVFDSLMKIIFIVLEIVNNPYKKGIIQLFGKYLRKKMNDFLISKQKEPIKEKEGDESYYFNQQQQMMLNFEENKKSFILNKFYFLSIKDENSFKNKFFSTILGIKLSSIKNGNSNSNDNKKEDLNNKTNIQKKNKTVYKSIKFQKKYGVYKQPQNELLEIQNSNEYDVNEDQIKLPISLSSSSPFKITLSKDDDYSDLQKMKPPMYIKDCISGLNSQYKDRQELSLRALPELIDNSPLDLDFYIQSLSSSLLRMENSFDIENFDEQVELILVKLTKYSPNKLTLILCERFFSENNCGLKAKFTILNVIDTAVNEISGYYNKDDDKDKGKRGKTNSFHPYFLNVIFPLLNYLRLQRIEYLITFDNFDLLLAKFMFIITNMIRVSENHPVIYKAVFETYDLFKAVISLSTLKTKTITLLEGINAYVEVTLNFYNSNFIQIYPEILTNFRIGIRFLLDLIEDKQLNDKLRHNIIKTLYKFDIQSKKFKEIYFGDSDFAEMVQKYGEKISSSLII